MVKSLVCGVGVNDADYPVYECAVINGKQVNTWVCPFYSKWIGMISRCYSKIRDRNKSYNECTVSAEWLTFSNFKKWMETQDWHGNHIDKDLFGCGRLYSAENCVMLKPIINTFINTSRPKKDFSLPVGCSLHKLTGKISATCRNPFTGKTEHLGLYLNAYEANCAWKSRKLYFAKQLAETEENKKVSSALVKMYS